MKSISLMSDSRTERCPADAEYQGPSGTKYRLTLLKESGELNRYRSDWQDLASRTADPNPFYEDWFFLPAVKYLGGTEEWRLLLIHADLPKRSPNPSLVGFFPFVKSRNACRVPEWRMWKNDFCYLTSPLVAKENTTDVLRAVMYYLRTEHADTAILDFPLMCGEGALHHAFTEVLRENLSTTYLPDQYLRAMTTCREAPEEYLKSILGGHHVREYRRKRRKLEALGQLEYRLLDDSRGADCWINWFLDLEANGWKARAGTAIKLHPDQSRFFREMVENGLRNRQVQLEGLFLNGEPIALKCLLLARPAAFAFKIAFDEAHHTCSPGVQLEFQSLEQLARTPDILSCDSCAIPGHQMIDRIWSERRLVRHLKISTGSVCGDLSLGALPFLRSINRVRKRWLESSSSRKNGDASSLPSDKSS